MNPIITSSFNKHPMSWELIHHRLLHPSDSVMKSMCRYQTIDGLPEHCPNNKQKAACVICYSAKMTTITKGTTVDTSNFHPGELIHMDFAICNVISIRGFTSMLTVVCEMTRMLWVFATAPKRAPVRIIRLILTALMNEQLPWKCVRVDEVNLQTQQISKTYLLKNSKYPCKLLVVMHLGSMKTMKDKKNNTQYGNIKSS